MIKFHIAYKSIKKLMKAQASIEFLGIMIFILILVLSVFPKISEERKASRTISTFLMMKHVSTILANEIDSVAICGDGCRRQITLPKFVGLRYNATIHSTGVISINTEKESYTYQISNRNIENATLLPNETYVIRNEDGFIKIEK